MAVILVVSDYQISCQMTLKSFNKHLSKALKSYKDPFQQHAFGLQYNKLLCSVIGAGGDFHGNSYTWIIVDVDHNKCYGLFRLWARATWLGSSLCDWWWTYQHWVFVCASVCVCVCTALAIEDIKSCLNLTEWTGDPCLPYPHSWLTCNNVNMTTSPSIIAV